MRSKSWLVVALLLPLGTGAAAAQGDDSGYTGGAVQEVLYGHIYDLLATVPMNTQPMDSQAPDLARGYSEPTVAPLHGTQYNQMFWFNSMGPVSYNVSIERPTIHPEHGLAMELALDESQDIMVYTYFSVDALEERHTGFEPPVHGGVLPQFTVRATLRMGNDVRKDLTSGELIGAGETVLNLITPPGSSEVTEIAVNLGKAQVPMVPRVDSFNLQLEWFQVQSQDTQVLLPGWNIHTGPSHPNRLVLPVTNPLYLFFVEPQFQDDKLVVNAAFNSPFGNYDVDPASLAMTIEGPPGFRATSISEPVLIQHAYHHNDHHVAVLNAWVWDYIADKAAPGEYKVTVKGANLANTATVEKSATIHIEDKGRNVAIDSDRTEVVTQAQADEAQQKAAQAAKRSPGFEVAALAGAIGLAMLLRRRQVS